MLNSSIPLAERMRPKSLDEVAGQQHLLATGKPLRKTLERGQPPSILLWGPPGVGKTTLARLVAQQAAAHFINLSAVSAGVKDVRQAASEASERLKDSQQKTILFLDEVHRFNKAQQDMLLPFVEDGTLTLIGATTENPSFEINPALRSRCQLYILKALEIDDLRTVIQRALAHPDGFAGKLSLAPEATDALIAWGDGDARRSLGALEIAATFSIDGSLSLEQVKEALSAKALSFDKGGEHFYNLISALHKSVRGCNPDASLYWLARMLGGGADIMYVARRLVRIASEDIGLADPNALRLAVAARDAAQFLGQPEGELALAQATVYLAIAPKSNAVYRAWAKARKDAEDFAAGEVPIHLRNAPTGLMKNLGYGKDYAYYFDNPEASFKQDYFPESINEKTYYDANGEGWEAKVRDRLERFQEQRKKR